MDIVSAFQAFSGRETALTDGSRTPARVVLAHSGLFAPWGILHGVGMRGLVAGFAREQEAHRGVRLVEFQFR